MPFLNNHCTYVSITIALVTYILVQFANTERMSGGYVSPPGNVELTNFIARCRRLHDLASHPHPLLPHSRTSQTALIRTSSSDALSSAVSDEVNEC